MNMTDKEKLALIEEISALEKLRRETDSKTVETECRDKLNELQTGYFDGCYVKLEDGKCGRIFHSFYGTYSVYFNNTHSYTWSDNHTTIDDLSKVEFLEEPYDKIEEEVVELNSLIDEKEQELYKLKRKLYSVTKDFPVLVWPDSFEETDERNTSAFNFSGEPVYYKEAFCEYTNMRVMS